MIDTYAQIEINTCLHLLLHMVGIIIGNIHFVLGYQSKKNTFYQRLKYKYYVFL